MRETCRIPSHALHRLPGPALPSPARELLDHARDMTSTLATFHRSPLRVEVLQHMLHHETYLREVFLRTESTGQIVEYGVIAIMLERFTPPQRQAIQTGEAPLGGLLHRFKIPFTSAPISFFSVSTALLARTPLAGLGTGKCHGRFNQLAQPSGEPLAWIMEILPPFDPPPGAPLS